MGISKLNPSAGGIPYGDTAGRPTASLGKLYGNGETARLEIYTTNGWQNIVQETPGVSSINGHYYQSDGLGTFTISGTNFVSGAIAYAVGTNGIEYQASTTTYNSLVQLTAVFSNLSGAYEPYDIKVVNPSNLFGLLPDAFYINESPVWGTTAGSLGSITTGQSVSVQLSSTDDESDSLTYTLASGSLPGGLSLSSSGLISGTASGASSQTFNFTVTVSDGINAQVSRSFSFAYTAIAIVTGGTLSSDSTYYYRTFTSTNNLVVSGKSLSCDILTVAGGGGAGGASPWYTVGGGGGAGGIVYNASQTLSTGTYIATVGAGGSGMVSFDGDSGTAGVNSSFTGGSLSLTSAIGGGRGGAYEVIKTSIMNGGSGGGGGGPSSASSYQGGSGTVGQGNNGGNSSNSYSSGGNGNNGGGGGGGAGAAGNNSSGSNGGSGGVGSSTYSSWGAATSTGQNITGTYYYAGGGGGGGAGTAGIGGYGGGGSGGQGADEYNGNNGTSNTGGGGGGAVAGSNNGSSVTGGNGGSGLVIVRYIKSEVGG